MKSSGFQRRVCRGINVCVVPQFVHGNSKFLFTFMGCRNTSKEMSLERKRQCLARSAIEESPLALSLEAVNSALLRANGRTGAEGQTQNNPTEVVSCGRTPRISVHGLA